MTMHMIDVDATAGTFAGTHQRATALAAAVMTIEHVLDLPKYWQNTAAFTHHLPASSCPTSTAALATPFLGSESALSARQVTTSG